MPKGIYQHKPSSKETKKKLSESHKGKVGKLSSHWKGGLPKCIDCGKELKSYNSKRCNKCSANTDNFKEQCRQRQLGKKQSKETIAKRVSKNKGQKRTKEQRMNISKSQRAEKGYWWKGGITNDPYAVDWTETLRRSIRERDNYTCQLCSSQQSSRAFCIHHIDYNKLNNNPNNLITLCNSCHTKTNFNRDYWLKVFDKEEII